MLPDVVAPKGLVQPVPAADSMAWLWFRPEREFAYGPAQALCSCPTCDVRQAVPVEDKHPHCFVCGRFISGVKRTYPYI